MLRTLQHVRPRRCREESSTRSRTPSSSPSRSDAALLPGPGDPVVAVPSGWLWVVRPRRVVAARRLGRARPRSETPGARGADSRPRTLARPGPDVAGRAAAGAGRRTSPAWPWSSACSPRPWPGSAAWCGARLLSPDLRGHGRARGAPRLGAATAAAGPPSRGPGPRRDAEPRAGRWPSRARCWWPASRGRPADPPRRHRRPLLRQPRRSGSPSTATRRCATRCSAPRSSTRRTAAACRSPPSRRCSA